MSDCGTSPNCTASPYQPFLGLFVFSIFLGLFGLVSLVIGFNVIGQITKYNRVWKWIALASIITSLLIGIISGISYFNLSAGKKDPIFGSIPCCT